MSETRELAFNGATLTSEQLESLADQPSLETLTIWGGALTPEHLKPLSRLTGLKGLVLGEMPINDCVFEHIAPLRQLAYLNMAYTHIRGKFHALEGLPLRDVRLEGCPRVGDECARNLAAFPSLRQLEIHMTGLTDEGLKALEGSQLEVLWVGPRVSDCGLRSIGTMKQLRHLDICTPVATDAGIESLAGLENLEILWLARTCITDRGVGVLARMASLRELCLAHTRVSPEGLAQLRQALPACNVIDKN